MESRRRPIIQPSWENIPGLVDYDMVCQVASEILPHMYLTTSIYRQIVPRLVDDTMPQDNGDDVREGIKEEPKDQSERNEDDLDYSIG